MSDTWCTFYKQQGKFKKSLPRDFFSLFFYLLSKRHYVNFYPPDCITKLQYHFNRPVLLSYSHDTQNITKKVERAKSNFYKNKKLFKIEDIDINEILVI